MIVTSWLQPWALWPLSGLEPEEKVQLQKTPLLKFSLKTAFPEALWPLFPSVSHPCQVIDILENYLAKMVSDSSIDFFFNFKFCI